MAGGWIGGCCLCRVVGDVYSVRMKEKSAGGGRDVRGLEWSNAIDGRNLDYRRRRLNTSRRHFGRWLDLCTKLRSLSLKRDSRSPRVAVQSNPLRSPATGIVHRSFEAHFSSAARRSFPSSKQRFTFKERKSWKNTLYQLASETLSWHRKAVSPRVRAEAEAQYPHAPGALTTSKAQHSSIFPRSYHLHIQPATYTPTLPNMGFWNDGLRSPSPSSHRRRSPPSRSTYSSGRPEYSRSASSFNLFGSSSGRSRGYQSRAARPRSGLIAKIRRFLKDIYYYMRRHPLKVFMLVIMPLITGGALTKMLAVAGVRLPRGMEGMMGGGQRRTFARGGARDFEGGSSLPGMMGGIGGMAESIGPVMSIAKMFI